MAEKTKRTAWGLYLQTCSHLGIPFVVQTGTTLNEKFGIQAGQVPDAGVYPRLGYFSLGNAGIDVSLGGDGALVMDPKQFKTTSGSPYNPIPLVLRPLGNDLSSTERANYALRRIEERSGVNYIAYYLKRLDKTGLTAVINEETVVNGVTSVKPFVVTGEVLKPVAPPVSTPDPLTADGSYISVNAPLGVVLSQVDTDELMNVFNIIYANPNAAIVSELALCSGLDKDIQVSDPGGATFRMNEAICVQVNDLVNVGAPLNLNSEGTTWNLDIGATEPMWS